MGRKHDSERNSCRDEKEVVQNESNQESGSKSLVADKESPKRKLVKESDADAETSKNKKMR